MVGFKGGCRPVREFGRFAAWASWPTGAACISAIGLQTKCPSLDGVTEHRYSMALSKTTTLAGTRFQAPLLDAIDSWHKAQDDLPTRLEAVRRLVELGMTLKRAGVQLQHHVKPSDKNV